MTEYLDDYTRCVSGDIEYASQIFNHKYNYDHDYSLMNTVVYKLALKNIYLPTPWIHMDGYWGINYINYKHYTPAMIRLHNVIGWNLSDHNTLQILKYGNYSRFPKYVLLPMSIPYIYKHKRILQVCCSGYHKFILKFKFNYPVLLSDIQFITYISDKYKYLLDKYLYLFQDGNGASLYQQEHIQRYFLNKISINAQTYKLYMSCRGKCAIYIGIMNEYIHDLPSTWRFYDFRIGYFIMGKEWIFE